MATENASATAPRPRPPQPIRARRIVLSDAACTHGTPEESTAPAAIAPPSLITSRRVVWGSVRLAGPIGRLMVVLLGMRYVGLASSLSLLWVSSGPAGNNDSLFAQIGIDQVAGFVASGDWRHRFQVEPPLLGAAR